MSRRRRVPKDEDLVSGLTVGELRALISGQLEDIPDYGSEADAVIGSVRVDVLEIHEMLEDLAAFADFMEKVYEWWRQEDGSGPKPDVLERRAQRIEEYARAYLELEEEGQEPTQSTVAERVGRSDRWIRMTGWDAITERAGELRDPDRK